VPPRNRPPRRPVMVTRSVHITPRVVRVTAEGDLADWPDPGPAAHMKIFLPQPDSDPVMRTYTVRRFDPVRGEVDIDFVLHDGKGPASSWARTAAAGDEFAVAGRSRSTFAFDEEVSSYLFVGEESSLPAIATCLEALPAGVRATVVAEVADSAEEQPLVSAAALDLRWLHREASPAGERLPLAVEEAVAEAAAGLTWVACEAGAMRRIRRQLLEDCGYPAQALKARGYWKRGESDHPDNDTGEADV
jgi:NADPH-dependent ferric siderophore reductase